MTSPVEVAILQEWRERADRYAQATGFPSMRTGKLAEYAVIDFFRRAGVVVREDQTPTNRPDHFDLNIKGTLVDVKSCLAPSKELRVTKHNFDRGRRFSFYIGIQVSRNRKKARIFGFCTKEEVKNAPSRRIGSREAYFVPFSSLQPIEKLVSAFRDKNIP